MLRAAFAFAVLSILSFLLHETFIIDRGQGFNIFLENFLFFVDCQGLIYFFVQVLQVSVHDFLEIGGVIEPFNEL
jgi:hypothetical protein